MTYYHPSRVFVAAMAECNATHAEVIGKSRMPHAVEARMHIAYAVRLLARASYPEVAAQFKRNYHTGVYDMCKRAEHNGGPEFAERVRVRLEA